MYVPSLPLVHHMYHLYAFTHSLSLSLSKRSFPPWLYMHHRISKNYEKETWRLLFCSIVWTLTANVTWSLCVCDSFSRKRVLQDLVDDKAVQGFLWVWVYFKKKRKIRVSNITSRIRGQIPIWVILLYLY